MTSESKYPTITPVKMLTVGNKLKWEKLGTTWSCITTLDTMEVRPEGLFTGINTSWLLPNVSLVRRASPPKHS